MKTGMGGRSEGTAGQSSRAHPDALVLPPVASSEYLPRLPHRAPARPSKTCIPLSRLFIYLPSASRLHVPDTARLDLFWGDGEQALQQETTFNETIAPYVT